MRNGAVSIVHGGREQDGNHYSDVFDANGNLIAHLPSWKANWEYNRRHTPAIAYLMDGWDGGDPFGSAMEMAFAVAEVGRVMGDPEPGQTLNYRPAMLAGERTLDDLADDDNDEFAVRELAIGVRDGLVSEDDLKFAARVLSRYIDICERAGKGY